MRILVTGDFAWDQYEPSFCRALRTAGATVEELRVGSWPALDVLRRAQMKYVVGPAVWAANAALLAGCARSRPDAVLAWRCAWLHPLVVRALRARRIRVVLYNNDDPFGPDRDWRMWRAFRRAIPHVDACFAYRDVNVPEYRDAGARKVFLLRSWFDPEVHRPLTLDADQRARFESDVTFAGHWEDDGREKVLDAMMRAGLRVRVFGSAETWAPVARRMGWGPVEPALGDDYARALCGTKIALAFLSRRNRDDYTRRCFEIPAVGTAMLAPRNKTLTSMFREGEEALFYGSPEEAVDVARRYVADDVARSRIAAAGHARCLRDGHDIVSRARTMLVDLQSLGLWR
jgi:spore maturation protein CgeB